MLTLITVTGDRPWSFGLCEKYMARQTIGWDKWIVVDDGLVPTVTTLDQQYVRLSHGQSGSESFRTNMIQALNLCRMGKTDKAVFIEDDDWYSIWHLEGLNAMLDTKSLAGQGRSKLYSVRHRRYQIHSNLSHASTSQTGFRGNDVKQLMMQYLTSTVQPTRLDGHIWKSAGIPDSLKHLLPTTTSIVSLKGVPGRGGLGTFGHNNLDGGFKPDLDAALLKKWLGEDAVPYLDLYAPAGESHANH